MSFEMGVLPEALITKWAFRTLDLISQTVLGLHVSRSFGSSIKGMSTVLAFVLLIPCVACDMRIELSKCRPPRGTNFAIIRVITCMSCFVCSLYLEIIGLVQWNQVLLKE